MSESVETPPSWFESNMDAIGAALWQDKKLIIAAMVLLGVVGAIAGKMTNKITSTAYLVLTPIPLREATTEDLLSQMIANPLQVTTASLLCTSDEVFIETQEAYNARVEEMNASEDAPYGLWPINDLWSVRNSLSYEITIEKETPYDTVTSPILQLSARGSSPAQAKLLVDTWAEQCVLAARKLQTARQGPTVSAFELQTQVQLTKLQELDERIKEYWTNNNPELVQEQLNLLIGLIKNYRDGMSKAEQEILAEQARSGSLDTALQQSQSTLTLHWTPPAGILAALGQQPPQSAPGAASATNADANAVVIEQENPVYTELATEAAVSRATMASEQARVKKIQELLLEFNEERLGLQREHAEMKLKQERLLRDSEVFTAAYKDAAKKLEYARMAKSLDQPDLQILSRGAEWPLPRFRRAILFGGFAAVAGFMAAALLSVIGRVILKPYFESFET